MIWFWIYLGLILPIARLVYWIDHRKRLLSHYPERESIVTYLFFAILWPALIVIVAVSWLVVPLLWLWINIRPYLGRFGLKTFQFIMSILNWIIKGKL